MDPSARIIEIFSSIQGEGIYVGQPHLFVRFWDCNLACHYCDTDYRGPYRDYSLRTLLAEVEDHIEQEGPHQAVSLTGGEPLLWWKFLLSFLPGLKGLNQRVYLETNGTLASPLEKVVSWVDTIAMDLKPPSATKDRQVWVGHQEFLRVARGGCRDLFVKIVVTKETADEELAHAFDLVSLVDARIPVVLQPVTPWGNVKEGPSQTQLDGWRRQGLARLADVRIIPQVHRMLGVP